MDLNSKYNIIKSHILDDNGVLKHYCYSKYWYENRDILHIYNFIFESTNFLKIDSCIKERVYCIINDIYSLNICTYCNCRNVKFLLSSNGISKHRYKNHCGSESCVKLFRSDIGYKMNKDLSDDIKLQKSERLKTNCRLYHSNPDNLNVRMERHRLIGLKNKGKKQSIETIQKRIKSREGYTHTQETKNKISKTNKEYSLKNPSIISEITRKKLSDIMKNKIKNNEFTPNITNSWTRWDAYCIIDDVKIKFRSTWEACYYYYNSYLEYEKIRIPYIDKYGNNRIYIVDFFDKFTNTLIEIKPKSEISKNCIKFNALNLYARDNKYNVLIITEDWFKNNVDLTLIENQSFYPKIKKLCSK